LLQPYEERLEIRTNTSHHYELWTKDWVHLNSYFHHPNNKKIQFAAIGIYSRYVSLHFHPVLIDRNLKGKLSPALTDSLKRAATFCFKSLNEEVIKGLQELFEMGWLSYKELKFVREGKTQISKAKNGGLKNGSRVG
jgi:hypothetical protein